MQIRFNIFFVLMSLYRNIFTLTAILILFYIFLYTKWCYDQSVLYRFNLTLFTCYSKIKFKPLLPILFSSIPQLCIKPISQHTQFCIRLFCYIIFSLMVRFILSYFHSYTFASYCFYNN